MCCNLYNQTLAHQHTSMNTSTHKSAYSMTVIQRSHASKSFMSLNFRAFFTCRQPEYPTVVTEEINYGAQFSQSVVFVKCMNWEKPSLRSRLQW